MGFNKLSDNNIQLRKEKSELRAQLGARTAEKAAVQKELEKTKSEHNATNFELMGKLVSAATLQPCFRILRPPGLTGGGGAVTRLFLCRRSARRRLASS